MTIETFRMKPNPHVEFLIRGLSDFGVAVRADCRGAEFVIRDELVVMAGIDAHSVSLDDVMKLRTREDSDVMDIVGFRLIMDSAINFDIVGTEDSTHDSLATADAESRHI